MRSEDDHRPPSYIPLSFRGNNHDVSPSAPPALEESAINMPPLPIANLPAEIDPCDTEAIKTYRDSIYRKRAHNSILL